MLYLILQWHFIKEFKDYNKYALHMQQNEKKANNETYTTAMMHSRIIQVFSSRLLLYEEITFGITLLT